ncbi:hypothetical protein PAAG_05615 [Paracoccidioides lutzii Pb01]|uniref:Uncharacterized protein n=1 Tax=Paracoccidioides lutzii (strain ATCC MYA-826 / Pb01) TaxID=502779 RepID=C1H4C2_PARBA|nr:hypothetical protein PAAG_05615 [Paracoccidioides lutzii Pb01]EEH34566.2 hypothetical protein PAAG_05615 [Paracoccidioides lutzii Pb01]
MKSLPRTPLAPSTRSTGEKEHQGGILLTPLTAHTGPRSNAYGITTRNLFNAMPGSAHKPSNNQIPLQNPTTQYNLKLLSVRKSRGQELIHLHTIQAKYHQIDDVASSIGEQFGMFCDHTENGPRGNTLGGLLRPFKKYPAFVRDMGGGSDG